MIAHKFGGTSVANAQRIRAVADILLARKEQQVVVVSAMSGVTDALINLVKAASSRGTDWETDLQKLADRHRDAAVELLGPQAGPIVARFEGEFSGLKALLQAQALVGSVSNDLLELISGLGEVWSSLMLDAALRQKAAASEWLDAREVLVVEKTDLGAMVDWDRSSALLEKWLATRSKDRVIVTGFVARDRSGKITTLGRNGSDYSGAIFGALFEATEIHIWTDVDGVLSADPRLVPEAVLLSEMSYSEACELAYFGAKVIHPQTMAPAISRGIPIFIRNTFAPEKPGTKIGKVSDGIHPVKGVTTISGLAVVNIEGAGMIGVPGTAERAFGALKGAGVSVVMISQGSSEHSICCVVQEKDTDKAKRALLDAFNREVSAGHIQNVAVIPKVAALAVVGDGMAGTPGIAARLFAALARARVNVRAIAQGASERNISVAISAEDAGRALRAVHAGFYLSPQTISIGLIGPGNVGAALLKQIEASRKRLLETTNLDLRVRAICRSQTMTLDGKDEPTHLQAFADHVHAEHLPHAVIIDCSGNDAIASRYAGWLAKGIHVITPSKHAGAGPWERYAAIRAAATTARFRYESTVGAGLPVIQTLRDLLDTGDEVLAVEGIFSGTLAYLFNRFDGTTPFSQLVKTARELGYTEPDPRDDLSGVDVGRKLVILARENGWQTSLEAVELESLVPAALRGIPVDAFMQRLVELDAPMQARLDRAKKNGTVLRYVARLEAGGRAKVGLTELPATHAFAHIRLTDNVVQFTTRRYHDNPLVVQGPGAGPEVTAAGIFADLLRIAAALGARL